jgi:RNA polymerase sigma-70 factor (ECF subfamily)
MTAFKYATLTAYSDENLMEFVQMGNDLAFTELVFRYNNRLQNFLFRYTQNHKDSEDLVQETFLRVHKSRHSYERIAKFSTWMYPIAINLAKSLYKRKKRMQLISIHKNDSDPDSFDFLLEDASILQDEKLHQTLSLQKLQEAVDSLQDEFKQVVILRDIEQMSYEEISEKIGVLMGTVKSRINRRRAQISKQIKEYVALGTSF